MSVYFWITIAAMTIAATILVVLPLRRNAAMLAKYGNTVTVMLIVAVPVGAIALYAGLGQPELAVSDQLPTSSAMRGNGSPQDPRTSQLASVADLVDGLRQRLETSPDDAGGWLLLAKSYRHLGRTDEAAQAYARATALGRTDAELSAYLAPGTEGNSTDVAMIRGRVALGAEDAGRIDGSATVFVIARNANGAPTPLAVVRTPVASLPFDFTLHDGMAMVAGNDLSSAESVVITAKISETGDALSTMPGFETASAPISTAEPEFVTLALGQ